MTLSSNPPPLKIPSKFTEDKETYTFFDALVNTFYRLWSEVRGIEFNATVSTADATNTAIQRVNVPVDRSAYIETIVVGRRNGGLAGSPGDSAYYKLEGLFKNSGGTLSLVGSVIQSGAEDQAAWNAAYSIQGSDVLVAVTGAANNDITWQSFLRYYEVGEA